MNVNNLKNKDNSEEHNKNKQINESIGNNLLVTEVLIFSYSNNIAKRSETIRSKSLY